MQMWGSGLFELQHIEADYQLQSSEIGHFITLSGRRVFEFYSELADFYFFIFGTGHKGQICNLQWFLAKCWCFHLQFSSDSEHMDHVSWIVLNPFKMLFSSHVSLIVLYVVWCLILPAKPLLSTGIISIFPGENSCIGCEKPVGNKKSERIWWEEATTASRDFCPAKIKIDSKLKTNTSVILRNFNQHRFIPNFKHLVEAGWFFKCSGLSKCPLLWFRWDVGILVIQMTEIPVSVQPASLSSPESAKEFPLVWMDPLTTDHSQHHSILGHRSRNISHRNFDAMLRIRDGGGGRRWSHLSPILTSLFGNWGLPRPRIHAWPKHRRYSRHTTRKPGSFLDCDLVSGGARWRKITQCWIQHKRAESKRGSRMGDQGPPPPAITVSFLTHPDSSEYACESQLAVPFALPTTFCCLFVAFWFFPPELLYLLRINDRQSLEILRIYNWGCKLGCKALQQTLECAHYHWQSNHSLAYR